MNRYRDYGRGYRDYPYDEDDRGFGERAMDEMRSWFGDEEAEYRRRMDAMEREREDPGFDRGRSFEDMDRSRRYARDRDDYERHGYGPRQHARGEMAHRGSGWAGPRGPGFEDGFRRRGGSAFGPGARDRYAVDDFGGTYGGSYGSGWYGRDHGGGRYGGAERWGASDWSERSARHDMGRYTGRGPSGYRRSAERITEDANEALTWDPEVDASQIQVKVEGDEVILEGTVDSRRAKRAAEEAVERVRGVRDVHNRLRVQAQDQGQHQGQEQHRGQESNQTRMGQDPTRKPGM